MAARVCSVLERLDLQPMEVNILKAGGKSGLLTPGSHAHISLPYVQNLRFKLRGEARCRMLNHKMESLPSNEDVEVFYKQLQNMATTANEDGKLIGYNSYKEALYAAPRTLRNFVSAKTFMDLLHINDARTNELVPVDSIIDFLVVKKDKLKKMISLHYYDSAGKGYLSVEDLCDYLKEEILPHIPSLASLYEEEATLLEYYLCMAARKFFFLLDPVRQRKVRITDIVASRLLEEFEALDLPIANDNYPDSEEIEQQETSKTSDTLNWFSKENCLRIRHLYNQLDTDGNGLLSLSEMTDFQRVTNFFMQRVFEVQQTYDNEELDLRGFCDLLLAMENKTDRSALSYYFRVMDVDGDSLLTASDLYFFYRDLAKMLEECLPEDSSQKAPPFEDIKDEVFDMCHPKNPRGITLNELVTSGKGGTVVGMLTDLDAFLEYENREDAIYHE